MHKQPLVSYRRKYVFSTLTYLLSPFKRFINAIYLHSLVVIAICIAGFLGSCTPAKSTVYFQNIQKDTTIRNLVSKDLEPKIQKGDLLGIAVASLSPDVPLYNGVASTGGSSSSSSAAAPSSGGGYLVDQQGNIDFIKLGVIHAEGLTKKELKSAIETGLVPYLKNVVVSISFLNRHITMLGGITSQVLPIAGDNMTILDALAASGDIIQKGRTDNVLIIREKGDSAKEFKRINLTNNSIFSSPYFFVHPNDIVYVEPKAPKAAPLTISQILSIAVSGISLIILILNSVKL